MVSRWCGISFRAMCVAIFPDRVIVIDYVKSDKIRLLTNIGLLRYLRLVEWWTTGISCLQPEIWPD